MANTTIWHNPRCRKSREGLKFLQDKGIEPEIFNYLQSPIDAEELAGHIKKSGQPLKEFIRASEKEYKTLGLKGREISVEEFSSIAAKHPKLLQRPIVIHNEKVVLARPAEKIEDIL